MQRRQVMKLAGGALLGLGAARLWSAPEGGPRFLLVFLRGGYDAANLLVPYASTFYYESRPNIAIERPRPGASAGALELSAEWALAPAVRDTVGALYLERRAAFVPFAGTEDLSRSHFETQDSIELGQPLGAGRNYRSGFLGRLAGVLGARAAAAPIAFTDALPLAFAGGGDVPNLSLRNAGRPPPFDERQAATLSDMYAADPLGRAVRDGLDLRREVARQWSGEMTAAGRGAVDTRGFERQAERMAELMRDEYRLAFVDVGGWDTHVGEGGAQGSLATNLASLGRGLAAYAQRLGSAWQDTVVVVLSEFGRTFRENGNRGTDHGHGSVHWVLGGAVRGGIIAGEQCRIERGSLLEDRDYPVLNDYRAVLGGVFRRLWGLSPAACAEVFPRIAPRDLDLV